MATILKTDGTTEGLMGTGGSGELILDDLFPVVSGIFDRLTNTSDGKVRLLTQVDGAVMGEPENAQATALAQSQCGYDGTVYGDAVEVTEDAEGKWY